MPTNSIQPAVFAYGSDNRPYATVYLQSKDGNFYPSTMLSDSGNDITLINYQTANSLGLRPDDGKVFEVEGVSPGVRDKYYMYQLPMRIGNYLPFMATVGVGPVAQNLLGRRDVFDRFSVTYADRQVVFRCTRCAG